MLSILVEELAAALTGQPLGEVLQLETHRFLLRFENPPFPRLHIALHPRLSTIHLARGIKAPASTTELAAVLTREMGGRRVASITKPDRERLVRVAMEGGASLVIELMGKASNVILLDAAGRIVRFARSHQGEFRRPEEGRPYEPPPPSPLASRSAILEREAAFLSSPGEDLDSVLRQAAPRPVVYAPVPIEDLTEAVPLDGRRLFSSPFPLRHAEAEGLAPTFYATMNEAEAAATEAMARHLDFLSLKQSLGALLRQEARRGAGLVAALEGELQESQTSAARDRRRAELILAGLRSARKEGDTAVVADLYQPGSPEVAIPIDPRLDLRANAERYFKAARRADRARAVIPGRLAAARERDDRARRGLGRLEGAASRAALEAIEKELQESGVVRAFRRTARTEVGRAAPYVPVREFRTREGFLVLVGRTAADNDHLTFHVAAPHDLWLHAAGYAGAHVIVRNPRRLTELPEATVLEAAAIAASLSKGKEEKDLDVHVAWRRHVRKGKGMGPGMVMLKKHRTVRVAPARMGSH